MLSKCSKAEWIPQHSGKSGKTAVALIATLMKILTSYVIVAIHIEVTKVFCHEKDKGEKWFMDESSLMERIFSRINVSVPFFLTGNYWSHLTGAPTDFLTEGFGFHHSCLCFACCSWALQDVCLGLNPECSLSLYPACGDCDVLARLVLQLQQ